MSGVKTHRRKDPLAAFRNSTSAAGESGRVVSARRAGVVSPSNPSSRQHCVSSNLGGDEKNTVLLFNKYKVINSVLHLGTHEFPYFIIKFRDAKDRQDYIRQTVQLIRISNPGTFEAEFTFDVPDDVSKIGPEFDNICNALDVSKRGLVQVIAGRTGEIYLTTFNKVIGKLRISNDTMVADVRNPLIPLVIPANAKPADEKALPEKVIEFLQRAEVSLKQSSANLSFIFQSSSMLESVVQSDMAINGFPVFTNIRKSAEVDKLTFELGKLYSVGNYGRVFGNDEQANELNWAMRDAKTKLGYMSRWHARATKRNFADLFRDVSRVKIYCNQDFVWENNGKIFVAPVAIFRPNADFMKEFYFD